MRARRQAPVAGFPAEALASFLDGWRAEGDARLRELLGLRSRRPAGPAWRAELAALLPTRPRRAVLARGRAAAAERALMLAREVSPLLRLVLDESLPQPAAARADLVRRAMAATARLDCRHQSENFLPILTAVLRLPRAAPGAVVEIGAYRGAATAKLSVAASLTGRRLLCLDTFRGLPEDLDFRAAERLRRGDYPSSLAKVRSALARFGAPEACELVAGRAEETLPGLKGPLAAAVVDADLLATTAACFRELYPRLSPGGFIASHDYQFPPIRRLLDDRGFWRSLGAPLPARESFSREHAIFRKPPSPRRRAVAWTGRGA